MTDPDALEQRRQFCRNAVAAGAAQLRENEHHRIMLERQLARRLAAAKAEGIGVPELAQLIGATRQHVYRQLRRVQQ